MRTILLLGILLLTFCSYSQTIHLIDAPIKVIIKGYTHDYLSKERKNKSLRQTSKVEYWFNSNGQILQSRFWGKQHNTSLKLLNRIEQHFYDSTGLLVLTQNWENSYENRIKKDSYQKFYYNYQRQLIRDELFLANSDTCFYQSLYAYDQNGNMTLSGDGANKYVYKYDNLNRLTQRRQFWSGNMITGNWVENYSYTDSSQIEVCDVYYDDTIIDYSTKTINTFKDKRIVCSEHDYISPHTSFPNKHLYEYNKQGLLISIKMYRILKADKGYELIDSLTFSYKGIKSLSRQATDLINEILYLTDSR